MEPEGKYLYNDSLYYDYMDTMGEIKKTLFTQGGTLSQILILDLQKSIHWLHRYISESENEVRRRTQIKLDKGNDI